MVTTAGKRSQRVTTERTEVSLSDFEAELLRLEDARESANLLIYGDSNVGKTWLAGSLPGRTFWLVGEPGWKSASMRGARGVGRIIANTATALTAVDWLNAPSKQRKPRYELFDWIVLDGMSTMQDRFRLAYAAEAFDANPAKRQHRNIPDQPDYFNTQNFLKSWIPQLVDMPVNLLILAHAYRTDKTENGELLVFPGIQGKVNETSNAISGLMDATGYYESRMLKTRDGAKEVRRLWFTQPTHAAKDDVRYVVGDKFNALGGERGYVDFPTMPMLMERIEGSNA